MAESLDLFREEFNRYKIRKPVPDLSETLDFTRDDVNDVTIISPTDTENKTVGLRPVTDWKICHLDKHPGFYVIVDPFLPAFKTKLIHRCLADYPRRPNKINLDAHGDAPRPDSPFAEFVNSDRQTLSKDLPLMKLRWATLGYQYNWTTKTYSPDDHCKFPEDLSALTRQLAEGVGFKDFNPEAAIVNYYHLKDNLGIHTDHSELDHQAPLISISLGCNAVFLLGEKKTEKPTALFLRCGDVCIMSGPSRLAYHAVPRILEPGTDTPSSSSTKFCERRGVKRQVSPRDDQQAEEEEDSASDAQSTTQSLALCPDTSLSAGGGVTQSGEDDRGALIAELKAISLYLTVSRININVRQVLKSGEVFPSPAPNSASQQDCVSESGPACDTPCGNKV